jgi:imidazolonepropionase-like amidohydrolase
MTAIALLVAIDAVAETAPAGKPALSPVTMKFVRSSADRIVLTHVRVIDGTGAAAQSDRNIVIENGKIAAIQPGADVAAGTGVTVLDLHGRTVLPGLVGMHDHLFYVGVPNLKSDWSNEPPVVVPQMSFSAPRLYLAGGVTTLRTTGSVEPDADLALRKLIDGGEIPGPHLDVSGPYLEGADGYFIQMHRLSGPEDARQTVAYWADRGVTSFKAYMNVTRAELKATIDEAHKRGLKVAGHLCSVTYPEAIGLGIDSLEHGFFQDTHLDPGKKPDQCSDGEGADTLGQLLPGSAAAKQLIADLVDHHVALTSTLAVFEGDANPSRVPLRQAALDAMTIEAREAYLYRRERPRDRKPPQRDWEQLLKRDMALEREFAAAGGLLMAGADPTGDGGVLPGFGDQRGIELLVEAGFAPEEAIRIATLNGAVFLGRDRQIGSVAVGKNADLVVVNGDPSAKISDIENVELVFKDGVAFDSAKLLESVRGRYGQY